MQVLTIVFFLIFYESICLNLGNTIKLAENGNIKSLKDYECEYYYKLRTILLL